MRKVTIFLLIVGMMLSMTACFPAKLFSKLFTDKESQERTPELVIAEATEEPVSTEALSEEIDLTNLETDPEVIEALNTMLIDMPFDPEANGVDVSQWPDAAIGDAIYGQLRQAYYNSWGNDYTGPLQEVISTMKYVYETCDYEVSFGLEEVKDLTMGLFGRELPTGKFGILEVTQNEVLFTGASGEAYPLSITGYIMHESIVVAIGNVVSSHGLGNHNEGIFKAVFQVNPDSIYGYTLLSLDNYIAAQQVGNLYVAASTEFDYETQSYATAEPFEVDTKESRYYAMNVLDGDLNTAWAEASQNTGVDEWIEFRTADGSQMKLSAIEFFLGYQKSASHASQNGWPTKVRIECANDYSQVVSFSDRNQTATLTQTVQTDWVRITILEAQGNEMYGATCISEIRLLSPGQQASSPEAETASRKVDRLVAEASSELRESTGTHYARYVLDGKLTTAWVEGVSGVGRYQWIEISSANGAYMDLAKIRFTLGYHKSDRLLERNGWPTRVRIECAGGYSQEVSFYDYEETVKLDEVVKTDWVRITILDAEAGTHYKDTCITEIRLLDSAGNAY